MERRRATGKVAARAGEQYDLYAYIRGELDADTTQGRFLIRAKFMDSNGASLGCSDITAMYPGAISSWTRVGGRVTAPANSVSMQVQYLLYQSSGWVNIDDVEVTIVPPNAASEVTKYYYFGSQRVAMRKNGVLTYLHGAHLGSTVLETNITGTVTTDEKYLAYGKQRDSGTVSTDHRFTGQKEDASGLQYFNARFYDPVIGMFVSPDTIVPQPGLASDYNRYLAFRGNPLKFVDPSGHFSEEQLNFLGIYKDQVADETWQTLLFLEPGDIMLNDDSSVGGLVSIEYGSAELSETQGYALTVLDHHDHEKHPIVEWIQEHDVTLQNISVDRKINRTRTNYGGESTYETVWKNGTPQGALLHMKRVSQGLHIYSSGEVAITTLAVWFGINSALGEFGLGGIVVGSLISAAGQPTLPQAGDVRFSFEYEELTSDAAYLYSNNYTYRKGQSNGPMVGNGGCFGMIYNSSIQGDGGSVICR